MTPIWTRNRETEWPPSFVVRDGIVASMPKTLAQQLDEAIRAVPSEAPVCMCGPSHPWYAQLAGEAGITDGEPVVFGGGRPPRRWGT